MHSVLTPALSCAFLTACSTAGGRGFLVAVDSGPPDSLSAGAPYIAPLLDHAHIGSDPSNPDFQHASAPLELTGAPFASVRLVADLTSPCFPWTNWQADPPPPGQNWPADCDAFDRNFELSVVDPKASENAPAIEVVRAITPFGGPEHIDEDVTDVFNALRGARTFSVTLGAYRDATGKVSGSNGGWSVSAHLEVAPGTAPAHVLAVLPLFYGDVTASQTIADLPFTLPAATTSSRLEYRATGHGSTTTDAGAALPSCYGPADEFCRRVHHVLIDGEEIAQATPWRNDCDERCALSDGGPSGGGQYCALNPCGSPDSVRASRANWCPGSVTPPLRWTPAGTSPGPHTFRFAIDGIAPGGQWRVSAAVFAYGD